MLALHRIRHVGDHMPSIFLILILIMFISGDDLNSLYYKKLEISRMMWLLMRDDMNS